MSTYPEPPETQTFLNSPVSDALEREDIKPELPSRMWPWFIGVGALLAIGIQTWSLFGLLKAGKLESEFQAKIAAWESANQNRQKAIDTWNSIEKQVNANIDQLREQSSLLQGTIESLQKQRDQMVQTTATQAKTLEALQSNRDSLQTEVESLRSELADTNQKKKELESSIADTEEKKKKLDEDYNNTIERGNKIRAALVIEVAKEEAQKNLLNVSTAELAALEAKIQEYDALLKKKLKDSEDLLRVQASLAQAAKDLEATKTELDNKNESVAKAEAVRIALKKELDDLTTARIQGDVSLASVKKDVQKAEAELADLRKKEQELSQQMATMAKAINTAAADATQALGDLTKTAASTIREMAAKAEEVRKAVSVIQVPVKAPSPTSDSKTGDDTSPNKEEGDK